MIAAFRRAGSFRGEAAVTTWLHRVVVNACLDRLRAREGPAASTPCPTTSRTAPHRGALVRRPTRRATPRPDPRRRAAPRGARPRSRPCPPTSAPRWSWSTWRATRVAEAAAMLELRRGHREVALLAGPGPPRPPARRAETCLTRASRREPGARHGRPIHRHAPRPAGWRPLRRARPRAAPLPVRSPARPQSLPTRPSRVPPTRPSRVPEEVTDVRRPDPRRGGGRPRPPRRGRHTGPVPSDVAARLDAVLAELAAARSEQDAPAPVVPLPTPASRRRRALASGLVAAAAVVALGVALPQLVDGGGPVTPGLPPAPSQHRPHRGRRGVRWVRRRVRVGVGRAVGGPESGRRSAP